MNKICAVYAYTPDAENIFNLFFCGGWFHCCLLDNWIGSIAMLSDNVIATVVLYYSEHNTGCNMGQIYFVCECCV